MKEQQEEEEETEAGKTGREGPIGNHQGLPVAELILDWMRRARPEEDGGRGTR